MPFDLAAYDRFRTSNSVGGDVYYRDETTSTMDDAHAGAAAGLECGAAYLAGIQTDGRGRLGRVWQSPGSGLYVTFHLCAHDAATVPLYSVAGALAVADAIRETCHLMADVKWPNDVLHEGKKLAGILAEAAHGERIDIFLGMGINLRSEGLPPDLAAVATSVEAAVGSSRVDLQACKLEYSIVSPK